MLALVAVVARMATAQSMAYYVVTMSSPPRVVAGPFRLLSECTDMANEYAKRYYNVSKICKYM